MARQRITHELKSLFSGNRTHINGTDKVPFEKKAGKRMEYWTRHLTQPQKKALVLLVLLLMASYFVYVASAGLRSSAKEARYTGQGTVLPADADPGSNHLPDTANYTIKSDTASGLQIKP
jgi:hypothetical protein